MIPARSIGPNTKASQECPDAVQELARIVSKKDSMVGVPFHVIVAAVEVHLDLFMQQYIETETHRQLYGTGTIGTFDLMGLIQRSKPA